MSVFNEIAGGDIFRELGNLYFVKKVLNVSRVRRWNSLVVINMTRCSANRWNFATFAMFPEI